MDIWGGGGIKLALNRDRQGDHFVLKSGGDTFFRHFFRDTATPLLAKEVMMGLEGLNTSLQGRGKTVGGMLSAVECVKKHFQSQRSIQQGLHQCN